MQELKGGGKPEQEWSSKGKEMKWRSVGISVELSLGKEKTCLDSFSFSHTYASFVERHEYTQSLSAAL